MWFFRQEWTQWLQNKHELEEDKWKDTIKYMLHVGTVMLKYKPQLKHW